MHRSPQPTPLSNQEIVAKLRELLGSRLVAYIASQTHTRPIMEWAEGTAEIPSADIADRLKLAHHIVSSLEAYEDPITISSWLKGMDPTLDDRCPAMMLREGNLKEIGPELVGAAIQLISN